MGFTPEPRRHLTKKQKRDVLWLQKGICPRCGEPINLARHEVEADHTIPLALGGKQRLVDFALTHVGCHAKKTKEDVATIAKCKRVNAKFNNTWRPSRNPLQGGRNSPLKRKVGGGVVDRATGKPL